MKVIFDSNISLALKMSLFDQSLSGRVVVEIIYK